MIYSFADFELDLATVELRVGGTTVSLEPQVFALLALLIENRDRLVSKDELIEKVWDGRVVSDAAVASRVKSARQALGDDGKSQQFIKTIHGQGYRFVAQAKAFRSAAATPVAEAGDDKTDHGLADMVQRLDRMSRPSLAVLPFRFVGGDARYAALANALPDELITDLARLHWLFVTARGSSFRLRVPDVDFGDIGRLLRVRYCLWGTIEVSVPRLVIIVELVDTSDGGVVWADRFSGRIDDVHSMREQIRSQVLVALEIRIPMHEASLARLAAVENLDAWSAYHLGLQHLYRFNRVDNTAAATLFQRAVALDPTFARAHAGSSFVHFQAAFMHYTDDVTGAIGRWIRSSISRWGARTGSRAISKRVWAGSSARRRSVRTMLKAFTPGRGRRPWKGERSMVGSTSIWQCASVRSIHSITRCWRRGRSRTWPSTTTRRRHNGPSEAHVRLERTC
jgi:TolB-like protein